MNAPPVATSPRGFLRDGVDPYDSVLVPLAPGVEVLIRPARASAADILAGKASAYAVAAIRARDAWVRASRAGTGVDPSDVVGVVVEAVRDTYDAQPGVVEAWLAEATPEGLRRIAAVAIGAEPTKAARERGRALALVAGGMGAAPLTAIDAAGLADWTVNAGRAPAWG